MAPRERLSSADWRPLLVLACFATSLVFGCGNPITPEQREAFAKYQALGGRVNFRSGGYEIDLSNSQVTDEDLGYLEQIANVTSVDLRSTKVSDAALKYLRDMQTLEFVALPRETVTDEAVESLRKSLPNTKIQH